MELYKLAYEAWGKNTEVLCLHIFTLPMNVLFANSFIGRKSTPSLAVSAIARMNTIAGMVT